MSDLQVSPADYAATWGLPVLTGQARAQPYRLKEWTGATNVCTPVALARLLRPTASPAEGRALMETLLPTARRWGWHPKIGTFFFTVGAMARAFGRRLGSPVRPKTRLAFGPLGRRGAQALIRRQLDTASGVMLSTLWGPWPRHSMVITGYQVYRGGAVLVHIQDGWRHRGQWVDFQSLCQQTPVTLTSLCPIQD
ncbi:hypothetical protein ACLGL1_05985 [Peptococcus simiae]|uniref:hypothetical protein n=1 Tax=Peptococcus simiae TaxID=1643805 RepID=UPI00397EE2DA